MKEKNLYNPLFESLIDSAHRYQKGPDFMVKEEDEGTKMKKDDVLKYLTEITAVFRQHLVIQIVGYPFGDFRKELTKMAVENLEKLKNSQSIDSLIQGIKKLFNEAATLIATSKKIAQIKPIWDEVKLGMEDLMKAYDALVKRAGSLIADPDILKSVNAIMNSFVDEVNRSIKLSAETVSAGKKTASDLF